MLNTLLFIGCYISGFFLALFNNPYWAFVLYQIVYFMNPTNRWWGNSLPSLRYSLVIVLLMLLVFLKDYQAHKLNKLMGVPQFKWIYLIAAGYVITYFYASLPDVARSGTIYFVKLVIILSIAYKMIDSDLKLTRVIQAYIWGAAYIGFQAYESGRGPGGRIEGIGTVDSPDSNGIAAAIVPSIVFVLYFFWINKKLYNRVAMTLAGAFIVNGIVLINSRGAFLATIIGVSYFMLYLLFSNVKRKNHNFSVYALIFLGVIAAANVVDRTAIDRFMSIQSEEVTEEEQTGKTRLFFWVAAIDMVKDFPFGAGVNGFEAHAPDYLPLEMATGFSRHRSVHSTWFEALTDLGYLGLFCLIMMLFSCYRATSHCKTNLLLLNDVEKYYKIVAMEAALISYMVAMSFMNRFRAEILYWLILYTACAYNIYVVKAAADKELEEKKTAN